MLKKRDKVRIFLAKLFRRVLSKRKSLARAYLHGEGLEIGALAHPLQVKPGVKVRYVDKLTRAEALQILPDLDARKAVEPDLIEDGFELASVEDSSQDFIIANHVLEHTPNPVGALMQWSRALRPGGILYLCVPLAAMCFDAGRPITPIQHFFEDRDIYERNDQEAIQSKNKAHFIEWVTISEPNIFAGQGKMFSIPSQEEIDRRFAHERVTMLNELHFHTFSQESFRAFLLEFCRRVNNRIELLRLEDNFTEVIAILRKIP